MVFGANTFAAWGNARAKSEACEYLLFRVRVVLDLKFYRVMALLSSADTFKYRSFIIRIMKDCDSFDRTIS